MDELRARLNGIQANEAATLNTRTDSVDFLHSVLETIDVAGLGIGVIGGITAMVLFVRAMTAVSEWSGPTLTAWECPSPCCRCPPPPTRSASWARSWGRRPRC